MLIVMSFSYSVYNALEKAPTLALGAKHEIMFAAYGELRVSVLSISHTPGLLPTETWDHCSPSPALLVDRPT